MRRLEQSAKVVRLDLTHLERIHQRATENSTRSSKRNRELLESLTVAIRILQDEVFGARVRLKKAS